MATRRHAAGKSAQGKSSDPLANIHLPVGVKDLRWLFLALPAVAAIAAALVYLKAERWQEALQWGLMGAGLGIHALPDEALPGGKSAEKFALLMIACGAALFGYWVYEQLTLPPAG